MTKLLTAQEVARYLGVSVTHVGRLVARGDLACFRVGTLRRFDPEAIAAFLAQHCSNSETAAPRVEHSTGQICDVCGLAGGRHREWCRAGEERHA